MDDNPYAPSKADDVAEAPPSHGWKLEGKSLFVRQNAILPMVDPFSGATADRMTLYRLAVRRRLLWARFLFFGCLFLWFFSSSGIENDPVFEVFTRVLMLGFLTGMLAPLFFGPARVHVFLTPATIRRRRISYWLLFSGSAALVLSTVATMGSGIPDWMGATQMVLLAMVVLGFLWVRFVSRRLICRRRVGDLFEIRGLHPAALARLGLLQPANPPS